MAGIMRDIHIRPVLNGFVVSVGCQTLIFGSITELATSLMEYHQDPEGVTKKYAAAAVNPTLRFPELNGPVPAAVGTAWGAGVEAAPPVTHY